ncbi:hypothetical protein ATANTOWER_020846 [Ataeniobius toweri]|uniref:Uncharacterized protein n=1 Tax=Ataeniobius toweri TaxID=208326 RepID=A0ABU7A7R6_9TELE|nr:hypothetical protein [Ataeniobius toweri]
MVIWTLVNNSLQLRSPRRRGSGRMNSSCVGCLKHLVVSLHFLCWVRWVTGELMPVSSDLRVRGMVHPGQVTNSSQ